MRFGCLRRASPWGRRRILALAAGALLSFGVFCVRTCPAWRARSCCPTRSRYCATGRIGAALAVLHGSGAPFTRSGWSLAWAPTVSTARRTRWTRVSVRRAVRRGANAFLVLAADGRVCGRVESSLFGCARRRAALRVRCSVSPGSRRAGARAALAVRSLRVRAVVLASARADLAVRRVDALVAALGTVWLTPLVSCARSSAYNAAAKAA